MNNKGQGAVEYLMTYGWAILVVIIVGIVLWQSGVFGTTSMGASGFEKITVQDFVWSSANNFSIIYQNTAGQTIRHANFSYTNDLVGGGADDTSVPRGKTYTDSVATSCTQDVAYVIDVTVQYASESGLLKSDQGTLRGICAP